MNFDDLGLLSTDYYIIISLDVLVYVAKNY
jgi:hypothetical protein